MVNLKLFFIASFRKYRKNTDEIGCLCMFWDEHTYYSLIFDAKSIIKYQLSLPDKILKLNIVYVRSMFDNHTPLLHPD